MPEHNRNNQTDQLTLNQIKPGEQVRVMGVAGGWVGHERLTELGFRPGIVVEMLAIHPFRGPVVVRIDNTQVAIGRGLAQKVIVEEIKAEKLPE